MKFISEFNDINVNTAEYANVINNRFNIFIDLNIDNLLILIDEREDWFFIFLRGIHVSALATISIKNRITRVLPRGDVESDFNTLPFLSREHDNDRPGVLYYNSRYLQLGSSKTL